MSLFDTGKENLIHEFKELVAKHSKIIPANTIIDEISGDDDEPPNFQQFPTNILQNLASIAEWLIAHNEDDYMNVIRLNDTRCDILIEITPISGLCSFSSKFCTEILTRITGPPAEFQFRSS
jgi:hypothetical protein